MNARRIFFVATLYLNARPRPGHECVRAPHHGPAHPPGRRPDHHRRRGGPAADPGPHRSARQRPGVRERDAGHGTRGLRRQGALRQPGRLPGGHGRRHRRRMAPAHAGRRRPAPVRPVPGARGTRTPAAVPDGDRCQRSPRPARERPTRAAPGHHRGGGRGTLVHGRGSGDGCGVCDGGAPRRTAHVVPVAGPGDCAAPGGQRGVHPGPARRVGLCGPRRGSRAGRGHHARRAPQAGSTVPAGRAGRGQSAHARMRTPSCRRNWTPTAVTPHTCTACRAPSWSSTPPSGPCPCASPCAC
jgi:hypothetical protein